MLKLVGQDYSAPAPLSVQDLCLEIERTVAFLVRFIGGRSLADTQDDPLLVSGVERQVQIICLAVERLAQIDAGIAERITDYGKLVAFRTVQLRGFANLNEMFGFDQRVWHFVENRLPLLRREIAEISLRAAEKVRLTQTEAQCGAITLIQHFGSALNLNIHYHMLVPDGVYLTETDPPYFRKVPAPTAAELQTLVQTISERIGRRLERTCKLVRDEESSYLALESEGDGEDALKDLQGHSIKYLIAEGPHKGRKAFKLQSLPPLTGDRAGDSLAKAADFSLHAGVATEAHQTNKLERVARYITRPPVAIERLSLTPEGNIRYALKTPYRDGTTHVIFEPLDFIARLASLVPSPRVNLTRYHGIFAPHHRPRAQIVPSARGAQKKPGQRGEGVEVTPRHVAMTWAQRLKRVF